MHTLLHMFVLCLFMHVHDEYQLVKFMSIYACFDEYQLVRFMSIYACFDEYQLVRFSIRNFYSKKKMLEDDDFYFFKGISSS